MRIGIDARFYGTIGKGIGRYTQKLLEYLEKIDKNNKYFVFLKPENFNLYCPKSSNFNKVLVNCHWYSLKEQIVLPFIFKKYKLDLVHFLNFNIPLLYKGSFIVTIHDLIHFQWSKQSTTRFFLVYFFKKIGFYFVFKRALSRALKIIAVSHSTKQDLIRKYPFVKDKVQVVYQGVENISDKEQVVEGIKTPYFLYIGNAYPHKNLETLILAFKEFQKQRNGVYLLLVGKMDFCYKKLKEFVRINKVKNVVFLGKLNDEQLVWLYKNALAFIFPSLKEGFGFPGLEAMIYGCPVICSNKPSLPEVYGQAAKYFDPQDKSQISRAMKEVIEDQNLRADLIKRGYKQVKKYSWEKCAQQTCHIYKSVIF